MSPRWAIADVPVGGVDLRTDPMRVTAPKVVAADNVELDVPGRARKRAGVRERASVAKVARGPTSATLYAYPRTIDVRDARWIAAEASGRILGHADNLLLSESGGQWRVRGFLDQLRITAGRPQWDQFVALSTIGICDVGLAGDVLVLVWARGDLSTSVGFYDLATGAMIHPVIAVSSGMRPRLATLPGLDACLLVSEGYLGDLYAVPLGAQAIRAGHLPTLAPPGVLAYRVATDNASPSIFDVAVIGQRVLLTYLDGSGAIQRGYLDPSGAVDGGFTAETPAAAVVALAVYGPDADDRVLIAWGSDAGNTLTARDYEASDLSANAAATTIDTLTGYKQITIGVRGTTWTLLYETGDTVLHHRLVTRREWDTSGSPSSAETLRHASLHSKLWRDEVTDRWYVVVAYESQTQPAPQVSYFVYAVRGTNPGTDPTLYEEPFTLVGILWSGLAGGVIGVPYLPHAAAAGDRTVKLALTWRAKQTEASKLNAARVVTIEHAPADLQAAAPGPDGASYAPGGLLWRIDEALNGAGDAAFIVTEAGFALGPEEVTATPTTGGSMTSSKSYAFRYYYRDFATGERSSAFKGTTVAMGGTGTKVNHVVPTLSHTNRRTVVIDVYRAGPDPNDATPFNLVATAANDKTANTVTIADTLADATALSRERDYLSFGEADELAPPACAVVAFGEGRAALALADDDVELWLSKQRGAGEPVRWSNLILAAADSAVPGRATGLAWNGPDLIVWRARSVQVLSGRGPDNTGAGGTMEPARVISYTVGCRSARTLVRLPLGWMWQALDGTYWLLTTAGELLYAGADVEPRTEPCVGAFVVPRRKQVHFVSATGTLVFHYDSGLWTTSSRAAISAAATPDGAGLYLPEATSLRLLEDDPAGRRDDGVEYAQRIRLADFRPEGVQGEFVVRRVLFAGGYEGPHKPLVRLYYDHEPGHAESYGWDAADVVDSVVEGDGVEVFGGASRRDRATQVYRFAVATARERCLAIGVEILDQAVGGAVRLGASFWLTSVGFEWAPVDADGSAAYRLEERRLAV